MAEFEPPLEGDISPAPRQPLGVAEARLCKLLLIDHCATGTYGCSVGSCDAIIETSATFDPETGQRSVTITGGNNVCAIGTMARFALGLIPAISNYDGQPPHRPRRSSPASSEPPFCLRQNLIDNDGGRPEMPFGTGRAKCSTCRATCVKEGVYGSTSQRTGYNVRVEQGRCRFGGPEQTTTKFAPTASAASRPELPATITDRGLSGDSLVVQVAAAIQAAVQSLPRGDIALANSHFSDAINAITAAGEGSGSADAIVGELQQALHRLTAAAAACNIAASNAVAYGTRQLGVPIAGDPEM